ncbi:MAG: calcium-binding protein [Pseudomonadota bacterium]
MANIVVTNLNDQGAGSLRAAIQQANGNAEADTITFADSLAGGTINLASTLEIAGDDINISGDIDGDGAFDITISGDTDDDGTGDVRLLNAVSSTTVGTNLVLNGFRLTKGYDVGANAGSVGGSYQQAQDGVAVANIERFNTTFTNLTIDSSSATGGRGAGSPCMIGPAGDAATIATSVGTNVFDNIHFENNISTGGRGQNSGDGGNATAGIDVFSNVQLGFVSFNGGDAMGGRGGPTALVVTDGGDGGDAYVGVRTGAGVVNNISGGGLYGASAVIAYSLGTATPGARGVSLDGANGADGLAQLGGNGANLPTGTRGITISGTTGDDTLTSNGMPDTTFLAGFGGDDTLNGSGVADTLLGGAGEDSITGGEGDDLLNGGGGDDQIFGGGGLDTIRGGGGDDIIVSGERGTDRVDLVYGGAGNDTISGGYYNDNLFGGAGDDLFLLRNFANFLDNVDGGAGFDTLDISARTAATTIVVTGTSSTIFGAYVGTLNANPLTSVEGIKAGSSNDIISVSGTDFNVDGGGGADTISSFEGDDTLSGGAGSDLLSAGLGNNEVDGGANNDRLTLVGARGDFTVTQDGAVLVLTRAGEVTRATNIETFVFAGGETATAAELAIDALVPPSLTVPDVVFVQENQTSAFRATAMDDKPDGTLSISGGADAAFFAINSTTGQVSFIAAPDFEAPADQGGDNIYEVEITATDTDGLTDSATVIVRVTDVDEAAGPVDPPPTSSGPTEGDDFLIGTAMGDTIFARAGDDTIRGLGGDDNLKGEAGADNIKGGGGADTVKGNGGADRLNGGGGEDRVVGGGGDDVVLGRGGSDTLLGRAGDDTLAGNNGDDLLLGNRGDDILKGQGGADTFSFKRNDGNDVIRDFQDGQDLIQIRNGANNIDQLSITAAGDDVLIAFSGTTVKVNNTNVGQFDADDFLF